MLATRSGKCRGGGGWELIWLAKKSWKKSHSPLLLYSSNAASGPVVDEQFPSLKTICISHPGNDAPGWAIACAAKSTDGKMAPNVSSFWTAMDVFSGAMTANRTTPGTAHVAQSASTTAVTSTHTNAPIVACTLFTSVADRRQPMYTLHYWLRTVVADHRDLHWSISVWENIKKKYCCYALIGIQCHLGIMKRLNL